MRQQDATEQKPFYSVCYQYKANPWTLYSHHHYTGAFTGTQYGTSSLAVAKAQADRLVKSPGIALAQVSKTTDCYNHSTVYTAKA